MRKQGHVYWIGYHEGTSSLFSETIDICLELRSDLYPDPCSLMEFFRLLL